MTEGVSASSLSLFIKNPYLFYEKKILGIDNKDESKYLDYMDQGTLIHRVIEKLYKPFIGKNLDVSDINFMKNQLLNESLNTFIELYSKEPTGKNLIFIEVVKEYIENTLNFELDQIKNQNARIKIISLEKKLEYNLKIKNQNVKLKGIIDRIDMFNDGVRIIDYKSGNVNSRVLDIRNIDKILTNIKKKKFLIDKKTCSVFLENIILKNNQIINFEDPIYNLKAIKNTNEMKNIFFNTSDNSGDNHFDEFTSAFNDISNLESMFEDKISLR